MTVHDHRNRRRVRIRLPGLRKPACQRIFERMAIGAVRAVQRLRHAPGQPEGGGGPRVHPAESGVLYLTPGWVGIVDVALVAPR